MSYIPHSEEDIQEMLDAIGKKSIQELFDPIPESFMLDKLLNLPEFLSEEAIRNEMAAIIDKNARNKGLIHFLGGGAYDHVIPAAVWHLLSRSEFYSAYTPYQPEISQGTLQSLFEFQTLICQLTGMEVANASMYDGASSAAEAIMMALRINKSNVVLLSETIHPEYQQVIETYGQHSQVQIKKIPFGTEGVTENQEWDRYLSQDDPACVIVQSPNFFGCLEPTDYLQKQLLNKGTLLIQIVTEPISLGMLTPPGELGADVVVGEFQSFGIPLQYGGPYGGFFATRKKYMRNMPGRIVGETVDQQGRRGFVLTLSTREQHIRRGKATSNICTNNSLCALAGTIYLALAGKQGLRDIAWLNLSKAEYARQQLTSLNAVKIPFSSPVFNEFVIELPPFSSQIVADLLREDNIIAGIPLDGFYPALKHHLLICVTEKHTKAEIDLFVAALERQCRKQ